jgi:hypothetical protein
MGTKQPVEGNPKFDALPDQEIREFNAIGRIERSIWASRNKQNMHEKKRLRYLK